MIARVAFFVVVVAAAISVQSCKWLSRKNSNIDKPSPTGAYRVKFESTVEDTDRFMGFHEWGSIQYLKGADVVYSRKWDYTDSMEDTVMGMHENITWLGNNVLLMGGHDRTGDKLMDEVTISNTTLEHLNYVDLSLAKYSHLTVFDLPPAEKVKVRVPLIGSWRYTAGEINSSFGFGGQTQSKKEFSGTRRESKKMASPNDAANVLLEITQADIK
jgi:hypothetical protein